MIYTTSPPYSRTRNILEDNKTSSFKKKLLLFAKDSNSYSIRVSNLDHKFVYH